MRHIVARAATAAVLLTLVIAPLALGHAELIEASPGPDETVQPAPPELVATFDQNLDPSRSSLEVRSPSGSRVARGGDVDADDRKVFRLALPDLEPGTYEVRWTSFSADDGELARGSYEFTVDVPPTPSPTARPTPSASPTPASVASPTPTVQATASPPAASPSADPTPTDPADDPGGAVLVPIVIAAAVAVGFGVWIARRR